MGGKGAAGLGTRTFLQLGSFLAGMQNCSDTRELTAGTLHDEGP